MQLLAAFAQTPTGLCPWNPLGDFRPQSLGIRGSRLLLNPTPLRSTYKPAGKSPV